MCNWSMTRRKRRMKKRKRNKRRRIWRCSNWSLIWKLNSSLEVKLSKTKTKSMLKSREDCSLNSKRNRRSKQRSWLKSRSKKKNF